MIKFKQKEFAEYDAMRSLYVELMKYSDRSKFGIIDTSALIPVLKGNNIVIEKFVISTSMFGRDKYRMYIKIGAKAKLPDDVHLPETYYDKRLASVFFRGEGGLGRDYGFSGNNGGGYQGGNSIMSQDMINTEAPKNDKISNRGRKQKSFSGGSKPLFSGGFTPSADITTTVRELLGEAVLYDKKSRSLVLEFSSIQDAIRALNILPFGLGYKIYLLNNA